MATTKVLVEIVEAREECFAAFEAAGESGAEAVRQAEALLDPLAGLGMVLDEDVTPVPLLSELAAIPAPLREALRSFARREVSPDLAATSVVVAAELDTTRLDEARARDGVTIWPNSEIALLGAGGDPLGLHTSAWSSEHQAALDLARSRPAVDCRPYRPGVKLATVRGLLGVERVWQDGFRGQNVTVGILDDGVDGSVYPVSGGFSRPGAQRPGAAPATSHGSMCAADVLVAAPWARLHDYPFLGVPRSGGALAMFQAVLDHRRLTGTPDIATNSWGFYAVPPPESAPNHEVHDQTHPLHRKVREVVASGAAVFFAAGNCGEDCPSGNCHASSVGPGQSIHGSNSLPEVITVAAVNAHHERIGYSSQGAGMFHEAKPDLAAYSHFFGNFGPDCPGGLEQPYDNGTSAAAPVAAGVGALLLSAFPGLDPEELRAALVNGCVDVSGGGWDPDYGFGIVNAAASYTRWAQL